MSLGMTKRISNYGPTAMSRHVDNSAPVGFHKYKSCINKSGTISDIIGTVLLIFVMREDIN